MVGLKQQQPIDAHRNAGEEKEGELLPDVPEGDGLFAKHEKQGNDQAGQQCPIQNNFAGTQGDVFDKQTDGTEYGHGKCHTASCVQGGSLLIVVFYTM